MIKIKKINLGISFNIIIDAINAIKCIYRIKKEDENKDIQIINKGYYLKDEFIECNKELRNKIKVIINGNELVDNMKFNFKKEGEYKIYIKEKEELSNMSYMFSHCESLESIDLSKFITINVTNMARMFNCCEPLQSIDLSNFNTSNGTNMSYMFSHCD